ncbi:protein-tyrosine-phosphatase [Actinopolymorpha rutila]|uniref:Protein-tyrosine phosphatase n=1 Tax=Actinopolymorpha rutila TaxID=446787 RepID=A0A852Z7X6_9ACTN|nr:protein-tyrosine-phosphatase [Actinopolymorpha rutila]NYH89061.1 protein-tyrosine phosphatase [Actinopolymorpha rutila]
MGDTFAILYVCTGNMCRSPMAERMTRAALAARLGPDADRFTVYSAGTGTVDGRAMTAEAAAQVKAYAADPTQFVSAELTGSHVGGADLVLAATRAHRSDVVTLDPGALRRTFTITEFARLAAALTNRTPTDRARTDQAPVDTPPELPAEPVERARALVAAAARARGTVRPPRLDDDDIPDPIGRSAEVYEHVGAIIAEAVGVSVTALVGS